MRRTAAVPLLGLAIVTPITAAPSAASAPAAAAPATRPPGIAAAARADGWTWPVRHARVVHPFDRPAEPWLSGHRGVDLAGRRGSPIRSAGAGTVAFVGLVAGVPVVTVAHADGRRTTYQPVEATVRRGQWVEAGEQIGRLGAISGHCRPAACLHWGLLRGSDYLDPLLLVTPVTVRLLRLDDPPTRDTGT